MYVMANGLNQARALRVQEVMNDYRNIQNYIAQIRANPSAEEYNEDGYVVLRRCVAEAQALLAQPFQQESGEKGDGSEEVVQVHLRRIIVDASVRRFKAQKIYLRATAALRWINARNQILQGQRPIAGHRPALMHVSQQLRAELQAITDARVDLVLRQADTAAGLWLAEDPPLATLQRMI